MIGAVDHHHDVLGHARVALADDVFRRLARELAHRLSLAGMYIIRVFGLNATGGQSLPPQRLGQNCAVLPVPGLVLRRYPAGQSWVEALEHILAHIGPTGYEVDLVRGALEVPDVAAARDVDQALHDSAIALIVEEDRWRDLIPVPRIVGMILECPLIAPVLTSSAMTEEV